MATALVVALALAPTATWAECRPSGDVLRVRVGLKPAANVQLAGLVVSVTYPADTLTIEGRGSDAGRAAVSRAPEGAFTAADDRDGELRVVIGKAEALRIDPLCEVTFHRCEGARRVGPEDVSCRVADASDPGANEVPVEDVRCTVGAAF